MYIFKLLALCNATKAYFLIIWAGWYSCFVHSWQSHIFFVWGHDLVHAAFLLSELPYLCSRQWWKPVLACCAMHGIEQSTCGWSWNGKQMF